MDFTLAVADQLAAALKNLFHQESLTSGLRQVRDQNRSLQRLLELESDLVGTSQPLDQLRKTIARVAGADMTALIRGESGVGKELVARAIHFNSQRRAEPFICLNCAALTESLLESELFGHEKGSFTGAVDQQIGRFEQAHGGTLFLDEVGEMPLSIQAKFLRVLEGHPFERIGGNSPVQVDVRVVAATNRDLEQAVQEGTFRKDLFYRLQILEIDVPPLRDRADDIASLADFFLQRCCQRLGLTNVELSASALETLRNYDWPGNVRELRNVIERAVVLSDGPVIGSEDVKITGSGELPTLGQDRVAQPLPLEAVERQHIIRTLEWTGGKKGEAARLLGINRSTLDRKLQRYQINDDQ